MACAHSGWRAAAEATDPGRHALNKTFAFLEILGRDKRLARASGDELGTAARAAGVDPQLADALARRDLGAFRRLLTAVLLSAGLMLPSAAFALLIFAPEEAPEDKGEEDPREETEEQPRQAEESPQQVVPQEPASDPAPDEPAPDSEPASGSSDGEPATGTEADAGGNSGDEAEPQEGADVPAEDEAIEESADESIDEADGEEEEAEDEWGGEDDDEDDEIGR